MMRLFFISALILSLAGGVGTSAGESAKAEVKAPGAGLTSLAGEDDSSGPIVITSDTLSADGKAGTALFEGSVVAKKGDITLHAGRMMVVYSEDGKVLEIKADEDVKLVRGNRVLTAQKAHYKAMDDSIVFTGQPRATERGNVITGTKITYMMGEDRSEVENSMVFIKAK